MFDLLAKGDAVAEFGGRDLHLVKKVFAIAALAIERQPGQIQSFSDQTDVKALFEFLIKNDVELERYIGSATVALTRGAC